MRHGLRHWRPAFVLREAAAVIAAVAVGAAALMVVSGAARAGARRTGSVSNLQVFGAGASSFAADKEDRWFSFSWHRGVPHRSGDGYSFPAASTDNQAFADEAVSMFRDRDGRSDMTRIDGWATPAKFNHLPLLTYLDMSLLAEFTASPSDHNVLAWQKAGRVPDHGATLLALLRSPGDPNALKRLAYSSSYQVAPAFFSPDMLVNGVLTYSQGPTHRSYYVGDANTVLGVRRTSQVGHPANKVMMFEIYADESAARRYFYAYDPVRAPLLFADGAVSVRSMADANRGGDPNNPSSPLPTRISYTPELNWEPPTRNGGVAEFVWGRIQWCRAGLRGRDFGGPEVPWVP